MPTPSANRVRIIGGSLGGRVVRFPPLAGVRPTPDRVRETVFNWLGQALTGQRTLELFAGTGVLSLESLSRGAALSVAVDADRRAIEALRTTAQAFAVSGLELHVTQARTYLARENRLFDVIYLDPPFADAPWPWLLPACEARLAADGIIYAESPHPVEPGPGLVLHRHARAGQVHYHLLARGA
ncbi:MAG: 16S rRNA (guanine(966)-N(2))-methyltransferase RsmD [Casimicrobiaceae bacterium]